MTDKSHYCSADFMACIGWLELMKKHHYLSNEEDHLIDTALYCVESIKAMHGYAELSQKTIDLINKEKIDDCR